MGGWWQEQGVGAREMWDCFTKKEEEKEDQMWLASRPVSNSHDSGCRNRVRGSPFPEGCAGCERPPPRQRKSELRLRSTDMCVTPPSGSAGRRINKTGTQKQRLGWTKTAAPPPPKPSEPPRQVHRGSVARTPKLCGEIVLPGLSPSHCLLVQVQLAVKIGISDFSRGCLRP